MLVNCNNCFIQFNKKPSEIGKNNYCSKSCNYKSKTKSKNYHKVNTFYKNAWTNMNIRCGKYTHLQTVDKCKTYSNINILFNRDEFKKWCWSQQKIIESLKKPSIDRINKNKDYTLNNMQIIEICENIRKDKTVFTFVDGKCYSCNNILLLCEFAKDSRRINGLTSICKKCDSNRKKKK